MEMSSWSWSRVFDMRPTTRPGIKMAANSRFLAVMRRFEAKQQKVAIYDFDILAKATCASISPVSEVEVSHKMIILINEEIMFCFIY
jgi:hypothetical protein